MSFGISCFCFAFRNYVFRSWGTLCLLFISSSRSYICFQWTEIRSALVARMRQKNILQRYVRTVDSLDCLTLPIIWRQLFCIFSKPAIGLHAESVQPRSHFILCFCKTDFNKYYPPVWYQIFELIFLHEYVEQTSQSSGSNSCFVFESSWIPVAPWRPAISTGFHCSLQYFQANAEFIP
jgi:hypothetical protein